MSENSSSSSPRTEGRWTPDVLTSDTDDKFLRSLSDFIAHEKRYLQCPDTGPDEVRYMIYRSAFNKVNHSEDTITAHSQEEISLKSQVNW